MSWLSILMVTSFFLLTSGPIWALELVSPKQYTEVHPGETITIVVKPSPGEQVGGVYFDAFQSYVNAPPYKYIYTVGPNELGEITVSMVAIKPESQGPFATNEDAYSSSLDLHLKSTLASSVKIQSISVYPTASFVLLLEPTNIRGQFRPTKRLVEVYGIYSDGVKRDISNATSGTTYSSSNANIVTVSSDGLATAVGPGKARITVQNGSNRAFVEVTVIEGK